MKRILIILRRLHHGGIETASINLANALADQGHEVHLWVLRGEARMHPAPNVHLHQGQDIEREARQYGTGLLMHLLNRALLRFLFRGSHFVWLGRATSRAAQRKVAEMEARYGRFDQIIVRGQGAFELLWDWRDPRIWQVVEGTMLKLCRYRWQAWFSRLLFQDKQVVCVSEGLANTLQLFLNETGVTTARTEIIYNGLPLQCIREQAAGPAQPEFSSPYLVHVGRLVPVKNQALLLRAYQESGLTCPLVIIGDGSERAALESLSAELGLSDRVSFLGHRDNPYPWVARASAFVLSSSFEGLGMVLLESLACGTQVVATDVPGGIREILVGEQRRLLAEPTPSALAAKMREALSDPVIPDATWLTRFDDRKLAQRYLELDSPSHD